VLGTRNTGPVGQRAPYDGQGQRFPEVNGYERRGGRPDDFAGRPADGSRSVAPLRWLGTMSTLTAALVLAGATVIGVLLTLMAGMEPGNMLGFFVILGSLIAVLAVRRGAVYLFFPVPALAFFMAALVTGIVHDREMAKSTAGLGAVFAQWVAAIFWPAVVATGLVLVVGTVRWLLHSPLVRGQSRPPAGRQQGPGNARTSQGFRPPAADPWADDRFTAAAARSGTGPTPRQGTGPTPRQQTGPTPRQGTGPTPRQQTGPTPRQATGPTPRQQGGPTPQQGNGPWRGTANGSRPSRDRRNDRDPWGDPRLPPDRSQPTGPRPQAPGTGPRPQAPARPPRPGQTGPGPSFSPAPSPQQPPRRQPPDSWTQR
jgi:hypothetical protein